MKNSIIVDGTEYVLKKESGDIKIVVVDRGFVYIANVEERDGFVYLTNSWNIRRWGTTKGLGELVNGKTPNTVLDYVGSHKVPERAIITLIDVNQEKWNLTQ